MLIFFIFGLFYYGLFAEDQFVLPLFEGENIVLEGRVMEEDRNVLSVENFENRSLEEKIIVYFEGDLRYGQKVKVEGRPVVPDEDFRDYFHKDGISVSFFDPELRILKEETGLRSAIYSFRRHVQSKIKRGLPFPESAILNALLTGDRTDIPDDLRRKFSIIGVAHLLAISGTHIVIISGLLIFLVKTFSIKRKLLFSVSALSIFIILVGAPPSAVRAGIMGLILILSQKAEREVTSLRAVFYVGLIMLLFNPLLLHSDIGFQLSFLAASGIIIFSGKLEKILMCRPDFSDSFLKAKIKSIFYSIFSRLPFVAGILAVTLSAQIFTLPLVYLYFDHLPFLAPVSNILLAPLLPVVMIAGIVSVLLSFLIPEVLAFSFTFIILRTILIFVELLYLLSFVLK